MKKLLLIALFSIGLLTVSNAQLFYTVTNQSSFDWEFKMGDASGVNGVYYPVISANGGSVNGTFPFLVLPLQFGGSNVVGCDAYISLAGPGAGTVPISPCFVSVNMFYNLTQFGFGLYGLNVLITN